MVVLIRLAVADRFVGMARLLAPLRDVSARTPQAAPERLLDLVVLIRLAVADRFVGMARLLAPLRDVSARTPQAAPERLLDLLDLDPLRCASSCGSRIPPTASC